jgi:hypothetical protein
MNEAANLWCDWMWRHARMIAGGKLLKKADSELNPVILMRGVGPPIAPDINVPHHRPCVEHGTRFAELILLGDVRNAEQWGEVCDCSREM